MKSISKLLTMIIMSIAVLTTSCSDNGELTNAKVTAVKTLYEPADNMSLQLQASASAVVYFEWELAKAEDSGVVLYELVFDKEGGDFTSPIYRIASGGNGLNNNVSVLHETMNKIGDYAGIGSAQTGTLLWTVFSSKGINELKSDEARKMTIKRLAGFSNKPTDVFITGQGSEGGEDLSKAEIMKSTDPGKFEIYTKLTADQPYFFTDANSGSPRQFYAEGENILEGESTITVAKTGVYRIRLNFNIGVIEYTEVTNFEIFFSPTNEFLFSIDYVGDGIWKAVNKPINFKVEGWGLDERYKIRMSTITSSGEVAFEWWGTPSTDSRPAVGEPLSYWFIFPVDGSQWDGKFKFATEMDGALVDVRIILNAEGDYTHEIIKVGDQ